MERNYGFVVSLNCYYWDPFLKYKLMNEAREITLTSLTVILH